MKPITLKQAREQGKLAQFIREQEKQFPAANRKEFNRVLKSMVSQKTKPVRGTSRKGSTAS